MVKKENSSHVGNSLLRTAQNQSLGGKFALLALKGNPKPPVRRVKVPLPQKRNGNNFMGFLGSMDEVSKVSDITPSVGEESLLNRPALVKEIVIPDDIDLESSVIDMSVNSGINSAGFSLTRTYGPKTPAASSPYMDVGTSVKTSIQPSNPAYLNHPGNNRSVLASLSHPKEAAAKKTMEINKGLRIAVPSPMTLNRFEVQKGQEHTAPESKEYMALQAEKRKEEQRQMEKEHMKEAKRAVKEELKREFQREQGEGFEAQLDEFDPIADAATFKKKSLVKKILGKLRPISPNKKKQSQGEWTEKQTTYYRHPGTTLSKEEATAMAKKALMASKQRKAGSSFPLQSNMQRSSPFVLPWGAGRGTAAVATAGFVPNGTAMAPFPVDEILMQNKDDSISDLDASIRKFPVAEIRTSQQARDDESVSTLGTPRIFEKLDNLLREAPNLDPPQVMYNGSMPPPPMVTSHDAHPLIDQLESGERSSGDKSAGTYAVEAEAVNACHGTDGTFAVEAEAMKSCHCLGDQRPQLNHQAAAKIKKFSTFVRKENGEDFEDQENDFGKSNQDVLMGEKPVFDEVRYSAAKVEDKAQPDSNINLDSFDGVQLHKALSPISEGDEAISPKSFHSKAKGYDDVIDVTRMGQAGANPKSNKPVNFDGLMDIAASKLEATTKNDFSPKKVVIGKMVDSSAKDGAPIVRGVELPIENRANEATPKTRGGVKKHFFSDSHFDLLPPQSPKHAPRSPKGRAHDTGDGEDSKNDQSEPSHGEFNEVKPAAFDFVGIMCGAVPLHFMQSNHKGNNHVEKAPQVRKKGLVKEFSRVDDFVPHRGPAQNEEEERTLLEKDDAYWDTLSTIPSTTKDESSESDKYIYEAIIPGPIPVEITMANKDIEVKPTTQMKKAENQTSPKRNPHNVIDLTNEDPAVRPPIHSKPEDTRYEADPDNASRGSRVADLIAAFESSKGESSGTISSKDSHGVDTDSSGEDSGLLLAVTRSGSTGTEVPIDLTNHQDKGMERHYKVQTSPKHRYSWFEGLRPNNMKPSPEAMTEKSKKSKTSAARSARTVSWGFEEVYEEPKKAPKLGSPRSDGYLNDDYDPTFDDEFLFAIGAGSNPKFPNEEDKNLLERTLELSKGIFASIKSQDLNGQDGDLLKSLLSFGKDDGAEQQPISSFSDFLKQVPFTGSSHGKRQNQHFPDTISASGASQNSPIDVESLLGKVDHDLTDQNPQTKSKEAAKIEVEKKSSTNARTLILQSKLDTLRSQRAKALERFHLAQKPSSGTIRPPIPAGQAGLMSRERDRLKYYTTAYDRDRPSSTGRAIPRERSSGDYLPLSNKRSERPNSTGRMYVDRFPDGRDDLSATSSDTSTPSKKARDLRRQLNEAMQASQEIRISQAQLGAELKSFKSKYYKKNDQIEDSALKAIGGR